MNSDRTSPTIVMQGITRSFPMGDKTFRALQGIDLEIHSGEFVAIVGPSGSGKSTLMYILGCLDRPTGGRYELGGRTVSDLSDQQLSRIRNEDIGFVFQQYNLLPDINVVENIALGLVYLGGRRHARQKLATGLAGHMGLGGHLHHTPRELSGGQMQRVAIARALAGRPRLILADEPTGNLDSRTGREILDLIRQLHRQGHTIVLVSHDLNVAAQAERIVSLVDGKVVSDERNTPETTPGTERQLGDLLESAPEINRAAGKVRLRDLLRMSVREGLLAKKVRTTLTMLGIVFGIAAVIAMNAITEGGKRRQLDQIRQIGLNNIQVRDAGLEGARLTRERRKNPYGTNRKDIQAIKDNLPGLDALTAWHSVKADLRHGDHVMEASQVLGVEGDFEQVVNFYVGEGRFITDLDQAAYHRVCVLGTAAARSLGLGNSAIGEWIIIGDEPFRVVGIMAHKAFGESEIKDLQIRDRNKDVYVPYRSLRTYFRKDPHNSHYEAISMRMKSDEHLLDDSKYVHRILSTLHNKAEDFQVSVPLEKIRQAQQTKEVFNVIIVVIAAISLIVGGIGIMNIMLANVTERTREIGIRRAIGASRTDIMSQFLAESLLISVAGGAIGLACGRMAGNMIELIFDFPVAFSPTIMAVAIAVSVAVGVAFGIYPAWLAARMDPVEALRAG